MRPNPKHAVSDESEVRRLIAENPWATLVSGKDGELVASHCPVLLDEEADGLAVVTHLGRPDDDIHRLGSSEVLLIVAGPHGYISPSWYVPEDTQAPTWNFSVAHCYGTPQIFTREENLRVLPRLVEHFEQRVEEPVLLDPELGERLVGGTVGFRLPITRFICKLKMSQDKQPQSRRQVLEALRRPGPYRAEALADEMEHALGADRPGSEGVGG
jgi:transcriptional regulator